jgi:hypothetical protein
MKVRRNFWVLLRHSPASFDYFSFSIERWG